MATIIHHRRLRRLLPLLGLLAAGLAVSATAGAATNGPYTLTVTKPALVPYYHTPAVSSTATVKGSKTSKIQVLVCPWYAQPGGKWVQVDNSCVITTKTSNTATATFYLTPRAGNFYAAYAWTWNSATGKAVAIVSPAWYDNKFPPAPVTLPSISGTPQVGQTLTANPGTYTGYKPLTFTYQWLRCPDASGDNCAIIAGATATTYTPQAADVGKYVGLEVAISNVAGSTTDTSSPVGPVQPAP